MLVKKWTAMTIHSCYAVNLNLILLVVVSVTVTAPLIHSGDTASIPPQQPATSHKPQDTWLTPHSTNPNFR